MYRPFVAVLLPILLVACNGDAAGNSVVAGNEVISELAGLSASAGYGRIVPAVHCGTVIAWDLAELGSF